MPTLTRLERAQDLCWSQWQSPAGRNVSAFILTPITAKQIEAWLGGADPPRPAEIPATWVHKESRLERMFTNGRQAIGPNEIGDVGAYVGTAKAPARYVAVIVETDADPVTVIIESAVTDELGRVSTTRDAEASAPARDGKIPIYRIVDDVATKVSER